MTSSILLAALMLWTAGSIRPADYYVATNGNDRWTGRLEAPNRGRTDGPFATVKQAQEAVRGLGMRGRHRGITVLVRGGTYYLAEPLVFKPTDSGANITPVVYEAASGETPVISGGVRIKGWKIDARGWWHVTLPEVARGEWIFSQLFVNGHRRYRPRLPKAGYYTIEDGVPPSPKAAGKGYDRFRFRPGEIRSNWHNIHDVEVLGFQTWTMARLRIESVDEAERTVTFTGHTRGLEAYAGLPKGNRYLVENAREALEQPGEFYLDRTTGELTYIPVPGENPGLTEVIAPRLTQLVRFESEQAGRIGVDHVVFRGLTFAHTNWNSPPEGNAFAQAEVNLPAAVSLIGAQGCTFEHCRIVHTGAYGVEFGVGCKRNLLDRCELTDMAGGGVKIGAMGISDDEATVASHNVVRNCLIAHGGRMHPAAVGIWIGQSHDNQIVANEIADLYYTGISVGWTWGYGRSLAHHNLLEGNHIHDIGQGVLSDMGGIYTLGISPGTVERANRIHDVVSFGYGGWGIYTDEGSTVILIEGNVVFRCKSAGFHQHYGRENVLRNNIFAFNQETQIMRSRAEDHLSFTFDGNVMVWDSGELLGSTWDGNNYKLDNNLYWHSGKTFTFAGMPLEQWRQKGQDVHSLISDPLFINPIGGDFRLKPGSPAKRIEFRTSPAAISKTGAAVAVPGAFPTATR